MALICSMRAMARLCSSEEKRDIREAQVGFHFFEAYSSSRLIYLAEIWHKNR